MGGQWSVVLFDIECQSLELSRAWMSEVFDAHVVERMSLVERPVNERTSTRRNGHFLASCEMEVTSN